MYYQARRQMPSRLARYARVVFGEAQQLFQRRKVGYGVLAVMIAGACFFIAATPDQVEMQRPTSSAANNQSTDQQNGGKMDTQQPASNGDQQQNGSSASIESHSYVSSDGISQTQSSVTVNGQPIDVPTNGSVHKTVPNGNGSSSVDITHNSSGGASSQSYTSLNVQVQSSGNSDGAPVD